MRSAARLQRSEIASAACSLNGAYAMPKALPKKPPRLPRASSGPITHRVPDQTHDYRLDPKPYPALKTEQGVFTTPPYSAEIKGYWRFKDEAAARESPGEIWRMFIAYQKQNDFIGADTARKFIQMGRTRSLRYALRPGGKKYEADAQTGEKKAMKRTGKVYDQGKLDGANVFEKVLERCWEDGWYSDRFDRWRRGERPERIDVDRSEVGGTVHVKEEVGGEGTSGRRRARGAAKREEEANETLEEVKKEEQ